MDEIDSLFRDDEEVKQKEAIFNKMNKDYIEKQQRKEEDRIAAENLLSQKEIDDAVQAEEHARFITSKSQRHLGSKRRRTGPGGSGFGFGNGGGAASGDGKNVTFEDGVGGMGADGMDHEEGPTTEEALLSALTSRKISRKINYDAMSAIFDDSGTFATDMLEDNEPDKGMDFELV